MPVLQRFGFVRNWRRTEIIDAWCGPNVDVNGMVGFTILGGPCRRLIIVIATTLLQTCPWNIAFYVVPCPPGGRHEPELDLYRKADDGSY